MQITLSSAITGVSAGLQVFKQEEQKEGLYFKHKMDWSIAPLGPGKVTAAKIMLQGSKDGAGVSSGLVTPVAGDGAIISPQLAVGSTTTNIAHGLFQYRIDAINYSKAADAVGVAFSAIHVIAASKFGGIAVYINAAGTITTKINSASQTDTLSFDTYALALANVDATIPPTDNILIGTILIENNGSTWTANTDDLVATSDVTTATFYSETSSYIEFDEHELNADEIINQKGVFYVDDDLAIDTYQRLFISEITGSGTFNITDTLIPYRRTYVQDGIA